MSFPTWGSSLQDSLTTSVIQGLGFGSHDIDSASPGLGTRVSHMYSQPGVYMTNKASGHQRSGGLPWLAVLSVLATLLPGMLTIQDSTRGQ